MHALMKPFGRELWLSPSSNSRWWESYSWWWRCDVGGLWQDAVDLTIHEIFGGWNHGACKRLHSLSNRARRWNYDTTHYVSWTARCYISYWAQRITAAIVLGDARRSLAHVDFLKGRLTGAPAGGVFRLCTVP